MVDTEVVFGGGPKRPGQLPSHRSAHQQGQKKWRTCWTKPTLKEAGQGPTEADIQELSAIELSAVVGLLDDENA